MVVTDMDKEIQEITNSKNSKEKWDLWAPFKLLKQEGLYWFWLITLAISFLGLIINIINGDIKSGFSSGACYSTGITIISPFLVEFFVELTVKQRKGKKQNFIRYKSLVFGVSILYIILSCIFIGSKWASLIAPQVLFALFTGVYSLYIYLVTKMDDHPGFLSLYKDKGYQDEENERVSDMIDGAQRAKNFLSAEGRNIEL